MYFFATIKETIDNLIWNWVIGTAFGIAYYYSKEKYPLCVAGEESMEFKWFTIEIDLCTYFTL